MHTLLRSTYKFVDAYLVVLSTEMYNTQQLRLVLVRLTEHYYSIINGLDYIF